MAVEISAELPEVERELLVARAAHLTDFQEEALNRFKNRVGPSEQGVLGRYVGMCGQRAAWMRQTCRGMDDGEPTESEPPRERRRRWREACPMRCD